MIDFRSIFLVVGLLLSTLAVITCVPAAVGAVKGSPDWQVFVMSGMTTTESTVIVGVDFIAAVSSATTAISNCGPALGPIAGPAGAFKPLPDEAKWLLTAGMPLGRLESSR